MDLKPFTLFLKSIAHLVLDVWASAAVALYNSSLEIHLTGIDLWTSENWDDFYDPDTCQARMWLMYDSVYPNAARYRLG